MVAPRNHFDRAHGSRRADRETDEARSSHRLDRLHVARDTLVVFVTVLAVVNSAVTGRTYAGHVRGVIEASVSEPVRMMRLQVRPAPLASVENPDASIRFGAPKYSGRLITLSATLARIPPPTGVREER